MVQRDHDARGDAHGVEVLEVVEHVADLELRPNPDVAAPTCSKVHPSATLDGEVVDVAGTAVIEAGEELHERQDVLAGIGKPQTRSAEKRPHVGALEMVDAHLAGNRQKRDVALDRRGAIEMAADRTGFVKLVIDEVVGSGEGGEIRIA